MEQALAVWDIRREYADKAEQALLAFDNARFVQYEAQVAELALVYLDLATAAVRDPELPGFPWLLLALCWAALRQELAEARADGIVPEPLLLAWQAALEQCETALRERSIPPDDDGADDAPTMS